MERQAPLYLLSVDGHKLPLCLGTLWMTLLWILGCVYLYNSCLGDLGMHTQEWNFWTAWEFCFYSDHTPLYSQQQCMRAPFLLVLASICSICTFWRWPFWWTSLCHSDLHFPDGGGGEHLFLCLLAICIFFWENVYSVSLPVFQLGSVCILHGFFFFFFFDVFFLMLSCMSYLYV